MTVAQRKEALMSWIESLDDENLLSQVEAVRAKKDHEIPDTLIEVLSKASNASEEELTLHTSVRELLKQDL